MRKSVPDLIALHSSRKRHKLPEYPVAPDQYESLVRRYGVRHADGRLTFSCNPGGEVWPSEQGFTHHDDRDLALDPLLDRIAQAHLKRHPRGGRFVVVRKD